MQALQSRRPPLYRRGPQTALRAQVSTVFLFPPVSLFSLLPPCSQIYLLLLTLSFTPSPRFPDIARFPLFLLYKLLLTRHSSSSRSPHSLHYLEPTHPNTNDCPRKHHITYEHPPTSSHLDPSLDVHLFAFRSCGDLDLPRCLTQFIPPSFNKQLCTLITPLTSTTTLSSTLSTPRRPVSPLLPYIRLLALLASNTPLLRP